MHYHYNLITKAYVQVIGCSGHLNYWKPHMPDACTCTRKAVLTAVDCKHAGSCQHVKLHMTGWRPKSGPCVFLRCTTEISDLNMLVGQKLW
jgi:hypothetical protein